jgi:DNA (cytosine-5)-methyltransferase 1
MELSLSISEEFKIVDLCAGTGGFSLAFHSASPRFKTVYANDMEPASKIVYQENFPNVSFVCQNLLQVDISSIPNMDILLAGFSCQPFSIAGERKGFEDDRSDVFWQILKVMDYHKPRIVVLENVKNLLSHDSGQTIEKIKSAISELGYKIKYKLLNTCKVTGVPQNRERVFLVCFLQTEDFDRFNFDIPLKPLEPFHDLLDQQVPDKYYYTSKLKIFDKVMENVVDSQSIYQYRRHYFRRNDKGICPTLTANMGSGGHNVPLIKDEKGVRKLTPRECFRFQGFPNSYRLPTSMKDAELYKLAGNAISVPVVHLVAKKLLEIL